MTKDDREGSADRPREQAASGDSRVPSRTEMATAETLLIEETESAMESAAAEDSTQLMGEAAETVVDEQDVGASARSLKATRVMDVTRAVETTDDGDETQLAAGQAETRVLDDRDKTPPPRVAGQGRAPVASRPPSRPTPIDPERGLPPGMILFGEYEIINVLGVGGMGEVYRAKHRRLEEHRAIKVMHADLASKKGASEFFYREAKALLAVRHPAVVHCHDLLSDDEGRVYLIMEMIEGIPLSKKMNDGPLSTDEVAILAARVAHGLTAAHRKGVIHRDLSPDNIVLPNGRIQEAKIIDFGIAKLLEDGEGTILDGFKGKLSYASPEQLGFFGGKIDGRSDFYSLGLVLAAAALGRPLAMGTSVVEAVDARRSFKTLPDAIPIGLRSAIMPLLALDPKDRPEHVDRLFVGPGGIEAAVDSGFGQGAVSPARSTASAMPGANRMGLFAGIAGAATLLLGGGAYLSMSGGATHATSPSAIEVTGEAKAVAPVVPPVEPVEVEKVVPAIEVAKIDEEAKSAPEVPARRRLTGTERAQIVGLLGSARIALDENRLMSPANDNAYDRYRKVLKLDPSDERAKQGLRNIAERYVGLAERAIERSDLGEARDFVSRAKRADPTHPSLARVQDRLDP